MADRLNRNAKPTLTTRSLHPENKEAPFPFIGNDSVPTSLFYKRNHFDYPSLTYLNYWLPIGGFVTTPKVFSMQDLKNLPSKTLKVVLECAGNKRSYFRPKVFGEQWEKGAINQGFWTGVPLKTLLHSVGIQKEVTEVIIEGYDKGKKTGSNTLHSFKRSLPLEKALDPDTLIAYEYNEQPIPFEHGFPLRLIVPNWYAMASVKWIKQITLHIGTFKGPFQTEDYVYYPHVDNDQDSFPVTIHNVNSSIQQPLDKQILTKGSHTITGIAWTGLGSISKVEISIDHGTTWSQTAIQRSVTDRYAWTSWTYEWVVEEKGEYTIMAKATDTNGRTQPLTPFGTEKGTDIMLLIK
ncbi:sulfite oxidase [Halalkalibacter krulwichiae]|uniref:TMAO/DMSO reductase n=1 Tax=Halalkalibacter krulwichiae TaxID=199441 RepID=A0A1X9MHB3_9BACI|nr:sulfite oxidase [Halalkalibacter krulwichiae]ARK32855.1 TMAO/DMSO reductase [Halalkalibacter krulwichiae]